MISAAQLIAYLESKGWYFDWEHAREVWGDELPPDAIREVAAWTMPQWEGYWSSDHLPPQPPRRRYERMQEAIWSQLLREEEPKTYGVFFKDEVER